MWEESKAAFGVSLTVSLLGLWFAWYRVYRPVVVASFREEVFSIRRDLFMLVARKEIAPSHPGYTRLRWTMNGVLRFAERFGLGRAILIYVFGPKPESASMKELIDTVSDDGVRRQLQGLNDRFCLATCKYLAARSPVLSVLLLGVMLAFLVVLAVKKSGQALHRSELIQCAEPLVERISDEAHRECAFVTG